LVRHYPGKVEYDATFFIDKNRNASPAEYLPSSLPCRQLSRHHSCFSFIASILSEGTNAFLKSLCDGYEEARKLQATNKKETVAAQFKGST